jgi:hypothetical protein
MERAFRVKATGQWCGPMVTADHTDGKEYAERVAVELGLEPDALEVWDSDSDPRAGALLNDPNVTPPAPERAPAAKTPLDILTERVAALEAKVR